MTSGSEWECFSDPSYYDMWCVRQKGERRFGHGFHLVNGGEAKALCDILNKYCIDERLIEQETTK